MQEYEIAYTYLNGCAGAAHPMNSFDEAELSNTDDYVKAKHGKDFEKFVKEVLPDDRVVYTFNNGAVTYIYEFTPL